MHQPQPQAQPEPEHEATSKSKSKSQDEVQGQLKNQAQPEPRTRPQPPSDNPQAYLKNNQEAEYLTVADYSLDKQQLYVGVWRRAFFTTHDAMFLVRIFVPILLVFVGLKFILGTRQVAPVVSNPFEPRTLNPEQSIQIQTEFSSLIPIPYIRQQIVSLSSPPAPSAPPKPLQMRSTENYQKLLDSYGSQHDFHTKLFMGWFNYNENQLIWRAQFWALAQKYGIDGYAVEKGVCVVSYFDGVTDKGVEESVKIFLKSVDQQNYTNYHLILIEDFSPNSPNKKTLQTLLRSHKNLQPRLTYIKNSQKIGHLGSLDIAVRNHCQAQEIVIPLNFEDALIGRQVFNLVNYYFGTKPDTWFLYTDQIYIEPEQFNEGTNYDIKTTSLHAGASQLLKPQIFKDNSYRVLKDMWYTNPLHAFRRELYMKIPLTHLMERGKGRYYTHASDMFLIFALTELAGAKHTAYLPETLYFNNIKQEDELINCNIVNHQFCECQARTLTPLMPLESLQDRAQLMPKYKIPKNLMKLYIEKEKEKKLCEERQKNITDIFFR